jgi:putative endonuclease
MVFFVYILECKDRSLYTGITNDLEKRLKEHSEGKGSKYVRSRLPFRLVYLEKAESKPEAMKREIQLKELSRTEKTELIENPIGASLALDINFGENP